MTAEKDDLADAIRAALDPSGMPQGHVDPAAQVARVKAVLKGLDPHGDERFRLLRHAYKEETFTQHYGRSGGAHAPSLLEWLLDKQKRHVIYVKRMVGRKMKLVPVVRKGAAEPLDLTSTVEIATASAE